MFVVGGDRTLRKVDKSTCTFICPGKAIKYQDSDIPSLRTVLETNTGWDAILDVKYLNVLKVDGQCYGFVSFRCTGQSEFVLVPVPPEAIRQQQDGWKASAEKTHFDENSADYNTSKAQRDRAVKNCTFSNKLRPSTVDKWEVHQDTNIVFFSPALSETEWELGAESDTEDAADAADAAETRVTKHAHFSDDEEEADPRKKNGKTVAIKQCRGFYEVLEDTVIGPVGKKIKCTFEEYWKLIGKGHRLMSERLTYKHATLCQGTDKEGQPAQVIFVSFLITDKPSANDPSYYQLHNLQKGARRDAARSLAIWSCAHSLLRFPGSAVDHVARMREQAEADGVDFSHYPCLNWTASNLINGNQLAPGNMQLAKNAVILAEEKKNHPKRARDATSDALEGPADPKVFRPSTEGVVVDTVAVSIGGDYTLLPIARPESENDGMYYFNVVRKGPIETRKAP